LTATVVQSCRACFMFCCKFYFTCDRSLRRRTNRLAGGSSVHGTGDEWAHRGMAVIVINAGIAS